MMSQWMREVLIGFCLMLFTTACTKELQRLGEEEPSDAGEDMSPEADASQDASPDGRRSLPERPLCEPGEASAKEPVMVQVLRNLEDRHYSLEARHVNLAQVWFWIEPQEPWVEVNEFTFAIRSEKEQEVPLANLALWDETSLAELATAELLCDAEGDCWVNFKLLVPFLVIPVTQGEDLPSVILVGDVVPEGPPGPLEIALLHEGTCGQEPEHGRVVEFVIPLSPSRVVIK